MRNKLQNYQNFDENLLCIISNFFNRCFKFAWKIRTVRIRNKKMLKNAHLFHIIIYYHIILVHRQTPQDNCSIAGSIAGKSNAIWIWSNEKSVVDLELGFGDDSWCALVALEGVEGVPYGVGQVFQKVRHRGCNRCRREGFSEHRRSIRESERSRTLEDAP